mmetsp:Transcript_1908/g.4345  ORF Transcript_1908/g.4345 Transcript_1908/m.4345 type:complete len:302 (+) Transcript_1908:168-1073(+)
MSKRWLARRLFEADRGGSGRCVPDCCCCCCPCAKPRGDCSGDSCGLDGGWERDIGLFWHGGSCPSAIITGRFNLPAVGDRGDTSGRNVGTTPSRCSMVGRVNSPALALPTTGTSVLCVLAHGLGVRSSATTDARGTMMHPSTEMVSLLSTAGTRNGVAGNHPPAACSTSSLCANAHRSDEYRVASDRNSRRTAPGRRDRKSPVCTHRTSQWVTAVTVPKCSFQGPAAASISIAPMHTPACKCRSSSSPTRSCSNTGQLSYGEGSPRAWTKASAAVSAHSPEDSRPTLRSGSPCLTKTSPGA